MAQVGTSQLCIALGMSTWNDREMANHSTLDSWRSLSSCSDPTTRGRAALALALLAALAGCDDFVSFPQEDEGLLGVRAQQGCPAEEDCSDATPKGLRATSLSLAAPPFITALGGTQTFALEHPNGEMFGLGFTATTNDDSIEVVATSPGQFTIRGAEIGGAAITLRDATTGEMYDRFPLYSKAIDRAFLSLSSYAVFTGSEVEFSAVLYSPDHGDGPFDIDEPMADEGLQLYVVSGSEALFTIRQGSSNDGVLSVAQTVGTGSIAFRPSAGEERSTEILVVDSIAVIDANVPQTITIGAPFEVCSIPFAEETFDVRVLGVPFSYQLSGAAEIRAQVGQCAEVTVSGSAPVELTVTGGGATTSVVLTATE